MLSTEDLTDKIRSRSAKIQFQEAMRAYSAGAYRASTITLWTAVMQDLTDKLRLLAETHDIAAQNALKKVDAARASGDVRGMQAFENDLLDKATTDFQLVTTRESEELKRLRDDRNACAHPSFQPDTDDPYDMTAEQVRAYARLVVDAVLSQPPIVGKALVDRYIADLQSESWPDDDLASFLRHRYFDRARKGVVRNVLAIAVKTAIRPGDQSNEIAGRCVMTIKAAREVNEELVNDTVSDILEKWRDNLSDRDLVRAIGSVGDLPTAWSALGMDNTTRAETLLMKGSPRLLIDERCFASGHPSEQSVRQRYTGAILRLSAEDLEELTKRPYPRDQWIPAVLALVEAASTFRSGETAMRMALRVTKEMTAPDLLRVAAAFVDNNQIHAASDVPQLIERIVEASLPQSEGRTIWQDALNRYRSGYDPSRDPSGYYTYNETFELLGIEAAAK